MTQVADAKTAPVLLEMSKSFLNDILRAKGEVVFSKRRNTMVQSGGRRTDEQRNAYWAAARLAHSTEHYEDPARPCCNEGARRSLSRHQTGF